MRCATEWGALTICVHTKNIAFKRCSVVVTVDFVLFWYSKFKSANWAKRALCVCVFVRVYVCSENGVYRREDATIAIKTEASSLTKATLLNINIRSFSLSPSFVAVHSFLPFVQACTAKLYTHYTHTHKKTQTYLCGHIHSQTKTFSVQFSSFSRPSLFHSLERSVCNPKRNEQSTI